MSMKSKETWRFAHNYCGNLWRKIGWIMFVISIIIMLFVIGKNEDIIGTLSGILCSIQLVFLVGPIFPTERALKKNFDDQDNRRV
jgi:hypothetical protein